MNRKSALGQIASVAQVSVLGRTEPLSFEAAALLLAQVAYLQRCLFDHAPLALQTICAGVRPGTHDFLQPSALEVKRNAVIGRITSRGTLKNEASEGRLALGFTVVVRTGSTPQKA